MPKPTARPAATLLAIALAACTPAEPPSEELLGEIRIGPETYPIRALDASGTRWKVIVDGHRLICTEPTETSCYWKVRHHLAMLDQLNDYK
ncbi:hypothetical protein OEZ60_06710 [Defluviimonas sp. WL0024]|uniref:Uncharacterized protein n=2 Tax=Albidovulum TaxID=205889 RepID=A0ABT3J2F9_9RHOB|nr:MULTISPECIES: hypothetical protein [Defluviimonas]MCU9847695.1 hypothetical protein [Defluviimonas sp. WL0024]MCW3781877.1 hypothetical protein [Defluviimonas salinarum]